MKMIHEKQVRQFCAIHCVNNLLQLSKDSDCIDHLGAGVSDEVTNQQKYITFEWRCQGRLLYRLQRLRGHQCCVRSERINWNAVATQLEFNEIAEDLTQRELKLMEGNDVLIPDSNEGTSEVLQKESGSKLSTMQRFRSHYGTPIFGNYSFEVIETALNHRGVTLEYFRILEDESKSYFHTQLDPNQNLIGFIVHENETVDSLSYLRRLGSRIPIIRNICRGGRHWWAITGVKRSCYTSDASDNSNDNHAEKEMKDCKEWFLIDSNLNHIPTLSSDDDLMDYLRDVQGQGALIFRCLLANSVK